jgi:hypothetical protein
LDDRVNKVDSPLDEKRIDGYVDDLGDMHIGRRRYNGEESPLNESFESLHGRVDRCGCCLGIVGGLMVGGLVIGYVAYNYFSE